MPDLSGGGLYPDGLSSHLRPNQNLGINEPLSQIQLFSGLCC